jgi:nickel-dependent lactate racemase
MQVDLLYGRTGLTIELPDSSQVIQSHYVSGLSNEAGAIQNGLSYPIGCPSLASLVHPGDTIVIVHTDITRATPNDRLLPVIIQELEASGVNSTEITLLNGLGTHRPQTPAELRQMLGDRLVTGYRCLQHSAFDEASLVELGQTSNRHPVRINRTYMEADVRILTGIIEPHFFAGFSGGPKAVLPSLAGAESVLTNHSIDLISHPRATWGVTCGNPVWEEMEEVALRTKPNFLVNVTLNRDQAITGVFAGEMTAAHRVGTQFIREHSMVPVNQQFDIVVTTNSGYPLDQNLYQSVKGMSSAAQIVKPGGAIIIATACEDGFPEHGQYATLLQQAGSLERLLELLAQPDFSAPDQWQLQIQAQIQQQADFFVYSEGLTAEQINSALLTHCADISKKIRELVEYNGPRASIAVLPDGPLTVPYLA